MPRKPVQPRYQYGPLLYKILFYAGAVLLFSVPVLSLHGTAYRVFWSWMGAFRYFYLLLVPMAFLALFRLQQTWGIAVMKLHMKRKAIQGMTVLPFAVYAACTFAIYSIMVHHAALQPQYGSVVFYFLTFSVWLIAIIWFISILSCNTCDPYFPYAYFLYAFFIVSISNYIECFTSMSPHLFETVLANTFSPIPSYFFTAVIGILLWSLYVHRTPHPAI